MSASSNVSRRDFLHTGSLAAGVSLFDMTDGNAAQIATGQAKSCIFLCLLGGPSQLETWDPKPDAPAEVRGPFRSIATSVAGIRISEHLPRMANLAHRYAILRTIHHDAAPIHETGLQLLQTGRLGESPHIGTILSHRFGGKQPGVTPFVILPTQIGNTGINVSHGQSAASFGAAHEPMVEIRFTHRLSQTDRERYGKTRFGDSCARSLQLIEQGVRCVVVNMFDTTYDRITWDCHAAAQCLTSTLDDYRRTLCPTFDRACATLLDDLHQCGLLDETLVIAMGEMGHTPHLNARGGRDHWPGCWSIMMAGGGVRGGQVIGASDRLAGEPVDRPIACAQVTASAYNAMGLRFTDAVPIRELFH